MIHIFLALLFFFRTRKFSIASFFHFLSSKHNIPLYQLRSLEKLHNNLIRAEARLLFLTTCRDFQVIPKFLNFRIPNNDKFNKSCVTQFQLALLNKEIKKS